MMSERGRLVASTGTTRDTSSSPSVRTLGSRLGADVQPGPRLEGGERSKWRRRTGTEEGRPCTCIENNIHKQNKKDLQVDNS